MSIVLMPKRASSVPSRHLPKNLPRLIFEKSLTRSELFVYLYLLTNINDNTSLESDICTNPITITEIMATAGKKSNGKPEVSRQMIKRAFTNLEDKGLITLQSIEGVPDKRFDVSHIFTIMEV